MHCWLAGRNAVYVEGASKQNKPSYSAAVVIAVIFVQQVQNDGHELKPRPLYSHIIARESGIEGYNIERKLCVLRD